MPSFAHAHRGIIMLGELEQAHADTITVLVLYGVNVTTDSG